MKIQVGDVEYRLDADALTWERRHGPQWVYVMDPQTSVLLCALATERTACDRWRKDRGLNARSSEYQRDVLSVEHDARRAAEAKASDATRIDRCAACNNIGTTHDVACPREPKGEPRCAAEGLTTEPKSGSSRDEAQARSDWWFRRVKGEPKCDSEQETP